MDANPTHLLLLHTLRGILPARPTATPEDTARRERDAIDQATCLRPATPEEAHLAAHYVAAGAWAMDCLRLASAHPNDTANYLRCLAQSASMSRQAHRWLAALERSQAERRRRDTASAASDAAPAVSPAAALAEAPVPAAPPAAADPATPRPPSPIVQAETYALHHRKRAVLIRRLGRLPDRTNIGWLPPEVVHAIATGTTPILCALDPPPGRALPRAA